MTDPQSPLDAPDGSQPADSVEAQPSEPKKVKFTKEPQPELSLAERKEKAGWNRNQIGLWFVVGGFAIVMILIGVVGELTKAR
ncbi:MAG TPA: hypothetical protein VGI56_11145 [Galbitalea sp.]|jgi:hypothetical protein